MRAIARFVVPLFLLVLAGCAARNGPPGGIPGAPAAPAAVERFLQLASQSDYSGMGWIFGTRDGPINERDPINEVEQRMYALAEILRHDGFVVGSGVPVPGRTVPALMFDVIMNQGRQTFRVPITAVQGPRSRWYVEQVDIEAVTDR